MLLVYANEHALATVEVLGQRIATQQDFTETMYRETICNPSRRSTNN